MSVFLTAYWKNLVFINYEVDKSVLLPYVPAGTELDSYNGKYLASLVGFMFLNTKVRGIGFPFHRNFEEFNLRFYVRRKDENGYKRGVVFVKEIVPRRMISWVAYRLYGERYYYHRMKHSLQESAEKMEVKYSFFANQKWNNIHVVANKPTLPVLMGTEAEFITEHYWGYTKMNNGNTSEYSVQHPRWNMYKISDYFVDVDIKAVYGADWSEALQGSPSSVFMADGSPVSVFSKNTIK